MKVSTLAPLLTLGGLVHAFFRMQCHSRLTLDQVDPIVNPGQAPATHVHTIMGGNNFNPNCTGEELKKSTCTSCRVKGDGSAYWVPVLYFQDESTGMFEMVEQIANMLVYYLPERGTDAPKPRNIVHMFPKDFRMLAGDPKIRTYPKDVEPTEDNRRQRAIGFNCLNYNAKPIGFLEVNEFPDRETLKTCNGGLRAEIAFPNCWDGVNSDSDDHRSHVAYPENVLDGTCPDSHPKRIISILYETSWAVAKFNDRNGRFVWSHADPTGCGYHGDFMFGWEDGLMDRVSKDPSCTINKSDGGVIEDCQTFTSENRLQSEEEMQKCTIPPFVKDVDFEGPMKSLPGCSKIEEGPEYASGCGGSGGSDSAPQNSYGAMPEAPTSPAQEQPAPPSQDQQPAAPAYKAAVPPAEVEAAEPQVKEEPQVMEKPQSKCKAPINKDDPNIVWVTETVTHTTKTNAYSKRTAVPHKHMHRKRHNRY